jgi:hypothetical protein
MSEFVDYAQLYFQGKTAKNTGDQALYSKRLLEYTMAKDAGNEALKALSSRWEAEDKAKAKHDEEMKSVWATILVILIIGVAIYSVWMANLVSGW